MHEKQANIRYLILTLLLVALLCACFAYTIFVVQQQSYARCCEHIETVVLEMSYTLQYSLELNRFQLNTIAEMLPYDLHADPEGITQMLDALCASREMEAIYLQLPDESILCGGTALSLADDLHSFRHDAKNVPYISDICRSGSNAAYIYQAVPILRDGQIAGILYGFLNLHSFPGFFNITDYEGQAQLYIVDSRTGDYLMDNWHTQLGNLYDGSLDNVTPRPGYSVQTMYEQIKAGKSGYFIFQDNTSDDWLYTYYMPAGINDWYVQLTVAEQLGFEELLYVNQVIYILALAVLLLTLAYLVFCFVHQHNIRKLNRIQLAQADFMYKVQQILFDAYENPNLLNDAMACIAQSMDAESVSLVSLKGRFVHQTYAWAAENSLVSSDTRGRSILRDFPQLYAHLQKGKDIMYYDPNEDDILSLQEQQTLEQRNIHNLIAVPLSDGTSELQGVLSVLNTRKRPKDCQLLHSVTGDLCRALKNMDSYQMIHNMGVMDSLTGLKNRNSFESNLVQYANTPCCLLYAVYIDVNGLHEVNNIYGHSAGDSMLRIVGGQVRAIFGDDHSYRIGGDEFAVFVMDMEEVALLEKIEDLKQCVRNHDYFVSVGYAAQNGKHLNIDALLLEAENLMYQDKEQFYKDFDPDAKFRERNIHLEKLVQEKHDTDNFLSLVASHYAGIYVVNQQKDVARTLFKRDYIPDILRSYNQRWLDTIRHYAQSFVADADRAAFLQFCDYDHIRQLLEAEQLPKLSYYRTDGERVCLRLFPTADHSEDAPELFWLFEKIAD